MPEGMGIGIGFQTRDSGPDFEFTTEWHDTVCYFSFPGQLSPDCYCRLFQCDAPMTAWAAEETQKAAVFLEDRETRGHRMILFNVVI